MKLHSNVRIFLSVSFLVSLTLFLQSCGGGGSSSDSGGSGGTAPSANTIQIFSANNGTDGAELWKSDGTTAGTVLVKDINTSAGTSSGIGPITQLGSNYFFYANDGINGIELWKTDGSTDGTVMLKDINTSGDGIFRYGSAVIESTLYFTAIDTANGEELWKTDGTTAGTVRISNINPGVGSSYPVWLTPYKGQLYFRAQNGSVGGTELYKYNPANNTTVLLKDLNTGTGNNGDSSPQYFQVSFDYLYFGAYGTTGGREVWRSNGTAAGTNLFSDINPSGNSASSYLTHTSLGLFYAAGADSTGANRQLYYVANGANSASLVKTINPTGGAIYVTSGTSGTCDPGFTEMNGFVYFFANNGANGFELWRTDGSAANTTQVKDINPDALSSCTRLNKMVSIGNTLFFVAQDTSNNFELWKSNGTAYGTVMVKDINSSGSSSPTEFRVVNNILYFKANDGINGAELWRSDGTSNGTYMVKDINPGTGWS